MMFQTENIEEKVSAVDYDTRLLLTEWVMKHIVEHAKESGSYRYLIYDRLNFGPDAYVPLCKDGLTISNEFDLSIKKEIVKIITDNNYDMLKPLFNICDHDGCYSEANCGWPSDEGYRRTCYEHMKKNDD